LLALALLSVSLLVGTTKLITDATAYKRANKQSLYWSAAQLEYEYLRLLNTLDRYGHGVPGVGANDLMTSLDILWSRIAIFHGGAVGRQLAAIEGTADTIAALAASLTAIEPSLRRLEPGNMASLTAVRAEIAQHAAAIHRVGLLTNRYEEARAAALRNSTISTYWVLAFLLVGMFGAGTTLIVLLVIEISRANRLIALANAAEKRAQDGEQHIQAIMATVPDGIITIDRHGIVESINPAVEKMFGHPASEIVGENISMLMPSPHREAHDGYLARYRAAGVMRIAGLVRELEARHRDGAIFPIELSLGELRVEGRPRIVGGIRDVSSRRAAEHALREAHDTLERRVHERTAKLEAEVVERQRAERKLERRLRQLEKAKLAIETQARSSASLPSPWAWRAIRRKPPIRPSPSSWPT